MTKNSNAVATITLPQHQAMLVAIALAGFIESEHGRLIDAMEHWQVAGKHLADIQQASCIIYETALASCGCSKCKANLAKLQMTKQPMTGGN